METIEDLTEKLVKLDEKDTWYQIDVTFGRLLAQQGNGRPIEVAQAPWGEVESEEEILQGAGDVKKAAIRKSRTRRGRPKKSSKTCWTFFTGRAEKFLNLLIPTRQKKEADGQEYVYVPFGGPQGIMQQSLERTVAAMKQRRYDVAPLDLIGIYPRIGIAGKTPCDSMANGNGAKVWTPEVQQAGGPVMVLTPRHGRGGVSVRVDEYFDHIEGRTVQGFVKIDGTCPLNEEQVLELLKSLKTLKTVGPSKKGWIPEIKVKKVKLSREEAARIVAS